MAKTYENRKHSPELPLQLGVPQGSVSELAAVPHGCKRVTRRLESKLNNSADDAKLMSQMWSIQDYDNLPRDLAKLHGS